MKNNELLEALTILEREKNISKSTLLEAIESSLLIACKNHFGKADNVTVSIDPETCEYHVLAAKTVVEEVTDPVEQISLAEARDIDGHYEIGDVVQIEIQSKDFGRIATMSAKNTILQKIREEERKAIFNEYYTLEKDVVTGIVQRRVGRNISINLGKADALLTENEQVRGEYLHPNDRVKVYVLEVKEAPKGTRILVSRTHPELVKRLFEEEVSEVRDGIVEIKSIAREAGSRTKMAVWSEDEDVDAVGACVGVNGSRVNAVVSELRGEKIDIIEWNENPAILIEHAFLDNDGDYETYLINDDGLRTLARADARGIARYYQLTSKETGETLPELDDYQIKLVHVRDGRAENNDIIYQTYYVDETVVTDDNRAVGGAANSVSANNRVAVDETEKDSTFTENNAVSDEVTEDGRTTDEAFSGEDQVTENREDSMVKKDSKSTFVIISIVVVIILFCAAGGALWMVCRRRK